MDNKVIEFIHCCKNCNDRIEILKKNLNIKNLNEVDIDKVKYILDFVAWWDGEYFEFANKVDVDTTKTIHFGLIFRSYIASHIRAILSLIFTENYYHANIILRRLIEDSLYFICTDILSKFGKRDENEFGGLFLYPDLKVLYLRRGLRLTESELKEKLKERYKLNKKEGEKIEDFKKRFFHYGEVQDFIILTSKLVCNECLEKLNIANQLNVNKEFIKTNKAKFKFPMKCEECKKDFDLTLIPLVPHLDAVCAILRQYVNDQSVNPLSRLKSIYDELSRHFVHTSVDVDFAKNKYPIKIENEKGKSVNLMGLDGLTYVLRNLSFLICDYYTLLKSEYNVISKNISKDQIKDSCKTRKKKFKHFEF